MATRARIRSDGEMLRELEDLERKHAALLRMIAQRHCVIGDPSSLDDSPNLKPFDDLEGDAVAPLHELLAAYAGRISRLTRQLGLEE